IRLFDTKKKDADAMLNSVSEELSKLAEMCKDMEGIETAGLPHDGEESESDDAAMDNDGGWVDEVELLTAEEKLELQENIMPLKLALVKVRKLAYKIIHSSTIVLPAWKNILKDLKMSATLMPRNVATCWNSTFDMLDYALSHRNAVDAITQRRDLGLRKFKLGDHEWAHLQTSRMVQQHLFRPA
ncbi:hypothetical protein PAXRUDRAFT_167828, partial [Paxillus rubicundulus Ve08.2h10]